MTDSSTTKQARQLACARCGTPFDCQLGGRCWCADEPYKLPVMNAAEDCLCPQCLRQAAAMAAKPA